MNTLEGDLLTTEEVAKWLRVTRRTMERWRRDGIGPVVTRLHPGGRPLYRREHVERYLDARKQHHSRPAAIARAQAFWREGGE